MSEYQGQTDSLLWQSKQARLASSRVSGLFQRGSLIAEDSGGCGHRVSIGLQTERLCRRE